MMSLLLIFMCLVTTACGELKNVALGKPTELSSNYTRFFNSTKAVDGVKEAYIEECFHTAKRAGKREWFMVNLQGTYKVHSVNILNRADCCANRLRNFKVIVMDKKSEHPENSLDSTVCLHRTPPTPQCQMLQLNCTEVLEGQFVYVVFMYEQYMHFCEIEVMAEVADEACELKNVALGKPTAASTKDSRYLNTSKAVDGIKHGNRSNCFATIEKRGEWQWFMVDLQGTFEIHAVNILNEDDCCGYRLSNFKIVVTEKKLDHPDISPDSTVCNHRIGALTLGKMTELKCTDVLEGQFVYMVLMMEAPLYFCEIEVMAIAIKSYELKNVALGKPTTATSHNYMESNTSKVVDGINATNQPQCFKSAYSPGRKEWFMVHLQDTFKIHAVKITHTDHDYFKKRMKNFKVVVEQTYTSHPENSANNTVCIYYRGAPLAQGQTTQLNCTEVVQGQYVYVVKMYSSILIICEMEVVAEVANKTCDL